MTGKLLNLYHFEPLSLVNGPGKRAVVWVQGCSLGCPGCFNPQTHPAAAGKNWRVDRLVKWVLGQILLFSGFSWEEIHRIPEAQTLLEHLDVLIAGRYLASRRLASGLIGSSNKTIHFLTNRYQMADLAPVPGAEVILNPNGEVILSGIDPLRW